MASSVLIRPVPARTADWQRAARLAVALSWLSLVYMAIEGGVGVWQGATAGSVALVGWGLASFIEGLASAVIVWRFTGSRRLSATAEHRAQRLVAHPVLHPRALRPRRERQDAGRRRPRRHHRHRHGAHGHQRRAACRCSAGPSTASPSASARRPPPARAPRTCCAAFRPPRVLVGLAANAAVGAWWLDPLIGLFIAFVAVREGREAWRGETAASSRVPAAFAGREPADAARHTQGCC